MSWLKKFADYTRRENAEYDEMQAKLEREESLRRRAESEKRTEKMAKELKSRKCCLNCSNFYSKEDSVGNDNYCRFNGVILDDDVVDSKCCGHFIRR